MRRVRFLLIGLVAAIIATLAGIYAGTQIWRTTSQGSPASAEQAVAHFFAGSLADVDGQPRPFSAWRGKTLVVNFWATWCPPCREELPSFSRLQNLYTKQGVQFVGIALDVADSVRAFAGQHPVSYPLLIGGSTGVELARQFGNASLSLPYTVIITPAGALRVLRLGPLSEGELDRILRELLAR